MLEDELTSNLLQPGQCLARGESEEFLERRREAARMSMADGIRHLCHRHALAAQQLKRVARSSLCWCHTDVGGWRAISVSSDQFEMPVGCASWARKRGLQYSETPI